VKHDRHRIAKVDPPGCGKGKRRQYAALPCRMAETGRLEVMMVTSRDTGRWVLPKGWPIKRLGGAGSAEREAFEEAGIQGTIHAGPLGCYVYDKRLDSGVTRAVWVDVFRLDVTDELEDWPERAQRRRRWFTPAEAAALVGEPALAALLQTLD
jgi:8-oxo-dGTP pyrophosphatase MutT (NUDIX family)